MEAHRDRLFKVLVTELARERGVTEKQIKSQHLWERFSSEAMALISIWSQEAAVRENHIAGENLVMDLVAEIFALSPPMHR